MLSWITRGSLHRSLFITHHHRLYVFRTSISRIADHAAGALEKDDRSRRFGPSPHDELGPAGSRTWTPFGSSRFCAAYAGRHKTSGLFGFDRRAETPVRRKPRAGFF